MERDGQVVSDQLVFVRQTIGNACGTIGLIHSICNNADRVPVGTAPPPPPRLGARAFDPVVPPQPGLD